jgi:putative ABC transport system substrate-binding protein
MLVVGDPFFDTRRDHIIAFATQQKLPALYQFREYAMDGGLMSYGVSFPKLIAKSASMRRGFSMERSPRTFR